MSRGQLSGIEKLPREADWVIAGAATALQDRKRTQTDVYEEFHSALEKLMAESRGELEFSIPSFSAFNRYSIKLAHMTRRLTETREIASTIAKKFDAGDSDNLTLIAAEAVKTLVFELLNNAGEGGMDPQGAMQLANALRSAAQAQGVSSKRRASVEAEFADKARAAVSKVVSSRGGASQETADIILKAIGVEPAKAKP
jgi:flagellar hook-basal body complex protein FliE